MVGLTKRERKRHQKEAIIHEAETQNINTR